jgi:hypothetical protein
MLRVTQFRFIAETEESFLASRLSARARDGQHFIRTHSVGFPVTRLARESAVPAAVAAKVRQRDKDLARIRDYRAGAHVANGARFSQEAEHFDAVGAHQPIRVSPRDGCFGVLYRHAQPIE